MKTIFPTLLHLCLVLGVSCQSNEVVVSCEIKDSEAGSILGKSFKKLDKTASELGAGEGKDDPNFRACGFKTKDSESSLAFLFWYNRGFGSPVDAMKFYEETFVQTDKNREGAIELDKEKLTDIGDQGMIIEELFPPSEGSENVGFKELSVIVLSGSNVFILKEGCVASLNLHKEKLKSIASRLAKSSAK